MPVSSHLRRQRLNLLPRVPHAPSDAVDIGQVFLVGCPRSGTTLLQCMLAAHPQIVSLPETHYFTDIIAGQRRRRLLGIASPIQQSKYLKLLSLAGFSQEEIPQRQPLLVRQYADAFTCIMNMLARQRCRTIWLEKTPQHVRYIPLIEHYLPRARFIHILRDGPDNIASLYDVSNRYTSIWQFAWNVDECIQHWRDDVLCSLQMAGKSNHLFVAYSQLVAEPQAVLERLCAHLKTPFEESMLTGYGEVARDIVPLARPFKVGAQQPISNRNGTKFYEVFTEEERRYILERIADINLSPLGIHISGSPPVSSPLSSRE